RRCPPAGDPCDAVQTMRTLALMLSCSAAALGFGLSSGCAPTQRDFGQGGGESPSGATHGSTSHGSAATSGSGGGSTTATSTSTSGSTGAGTGGGGPE